MRTRIKQPCQGCQRRGITLFWGKCVRCHNQSDRNRKHHESEIDHLRHVSLKATSEIRRLQEELAAARAEIREWEECYAGQFAGKIRLDLSAG